MTVVNLYCVDPDHSAREGEEGWTSAPVASVSFDGPAPADVASRYITLCEACARAQNAANGG